jgi:hypothetical protein
VARHVRSTRSSAQCFDDFVELHWKAYKDREGVSERNWTLRQPRALRTATLAATSASFSRAQSNSPSSSRHKKRLVSNIKTKREEVLEAAKQSLDDFGVFNICIRYSHN